MAEEPSGGPLPDVRVLPLGIEHPVFEHSPAFVGSPLGAPIDAAGGAGVDLDGQVRGPLDVLLLDDRGPLVGDEEEIGLNDIVGREDHVCGSDENLSNRVELDVTSKLKRKSECHPLMPYERRGARVVLSVDDLMALPVVRNEEVILVGQLLGGKV